MGDYILSLFQLGLTPYAGPADGINGPQTQKGISTLQRGTRNPQVDGEIGPMTEHFVSILQSGLARGGPCSTDGVFGPQSNGATRHAQDELRNHGCNPGETDGVPGQMWVSAVEDFQARNGLAVDGMFGPMTGSALFGAPLPVPPVPDVNKLAGEGIDVYEGNGGIEWSAVRAVGRNAAYIKANEGDYLDTRFTNARVQAMDAAGVILGAYDFLRVRTDRSGADEARMFIDRLHAVGGGARKSDMALCADFEVSNGYGPSTCYAYLADWIDEVQRQGYPACVYVSPGLWASLTGNARDNRGASLWVAHYGVPSPSIPPAWSRADGWQYTSTGSVAGVSPPTDMDHWYSMSRI